MIGFVSEYLPKTGALGMSLVGGAGMLATGMWNPVIGSWLDEEKQIALNSGVAEDAAEVIAGQAALGNMVYFPLALIILFGILFAFRNKLEETPQQFNKIYRMSNKIRLGILGGGGDSLLVFFTESLQVCSTDMKL